MLEKEQMKTVKENGNERKEKKIINRYEIRRMNYYEEMARLISGWQSILCELIELILMGLDSLRNM